MGHNGCSNLWTRELDNVVIDAGRDIGQVVATVSQTTQAATGIDGYRVRFSRVTIENEGKTRLIVAEECSAVVQYCE